jgi:hypothetical protein
MMCIGISVKQGLNNSNQLEPICRLLSIAIFKAEVTQDKQYDRTPFNEGALK